MRIRRKTWARPELAACPYYIPQPEAQKGHWQEVFSSPRPIHLDLGCGKCVFLAQAAHTHRDVNFIGIDISLDILGVARRNIQEAYGEEQPDNVALCAYNIERLPQLFAPGEQVERIYINFCNPWSKNASSHKHRLTHPRQLLQYRALMDEGAEIWFKTDDDDLFRDSLSYFPAAGFEITWQIYDLHADEPAWNLRTEHEGMFTEQGIPIKALIARKGPDSAVTWVEPKELARRLDSEDGEEEE